MAIVGQTKYLAALLLVIPLQLAWSSELPPVLPDISYENTTSIVEGANNWARAALRYRSKALEGTEPMMGTYVGKARMDLLLEYQFAIEGAVDAATVALDRGASRDELGYIDRVLETILNSPRSVGGGVLSRFAGKLDHSEEIESDRLVESMVSLRSRIARAPNSSSLSPQFEQIASDLPSELDEPYRWLATNGLELSPGSTEDARMRFDLIVDAAGKVYRGENVGPAIVGAPDRESRMVRFRDELITAYGPDKVLTTDETLRFIDSVIVSEPPTRLHLTVPKDLLNQ